jgi:hypothetical protein
MIKDYVAYAASFIDYFETQSESDPSFIPERDMASKVVHLMRTHSPARPASREIVDLMKAIDSVHHYDGSGWHGFKNAVRWWLAERGVDL